jgi:uncharacterized protein YqeY
LGLQAQIVSDMREAIKGDNKGKLAALRFLVGEFTHIPNEELGKYPNKELPDEKVVSIIKKCITSEQSLRSPDSTYLEVLESYLPAQVTDAEILTWIQDNIDFTQFKNKMQAIKPVLAHFAGRADGTRVKSILEKV